MPVAAQEEEVVEDHSDQAGMPQSPHGSGEVILVVDDDSDLLQASADQLKGLGYQVVTAKDGAEALEKLAGEPTIRLLYTDLVMPAPWDGVNLAREVLSRRSDLPILYTSGEIREVSGPPAELLRKPVPLEKLAFSVWRLLDG